MKTLLQITKKYLEKYTFSKGQEEEAIADGKEILIDINNRIAADPAIKELAVYYTVNILAAMKKTKSTNPEAIIFSGLVKAMIDWEEVNNEFHAQFNPQSLKP